MPAKENTSRIREVDGFDVTCVVGRVFFDETGDVSPEVAAFRIIAEHGTDGEYTFPAPDGSTYHVSVWRDISTSQVA